LMNLDNIHEGTYSGSFKYGNRRYNDKDRYKELVVNAEPGDANQIKLVYKPSIRRKATIINQFFPVNILKY